MPVQSPFRPRIDRFAAFWTAPALIWQSAFSLAPLLVLVSMSFRVVSNSRLTPDFVLANWERMLTRNFFRAAYRFTFAQALTTAIVASLVAFHAAHWLAFRASPDVRRAASFLLVTLFFTSCVVRIYSWKAILPDQGVVNVMLGWIGLGPFRMLDTPFGAIVGYLTLCLPLVILIQLFALSNVDRALTGAAHNPGCGPIRTVFAVTIPAARIGLILAATFAFILSFGDHVSPAYPGGDRPPALSILIEDQTKSGNHWPRAAVVAVVMVVTVVTVLCAALFAAYGRPGRRE
jgi:spermidine/putrescine transport system permease protein